MAMRVRLVATALAAIVLHAATAAANYDPPMTTVPNSDAEVAAQALNEGAWERAVEGFTAALRAEPGTAAFHNGLGYAYRKLGRIDDSFRHYREALRLDPALRSAHEYIGEAYLMVGDKASARGHLARLEALCKGRGCPEYQDLARAIDAAK